jgi:hypothetical protein
MEYFGLSVKGLRDAKYAELKRCWTQFEAVTNGFACPNLRGVLSDSILRWNRVPKGWYQPFGRSKCTESTLPTVSYRQWHYCG